MSLLNCRPVIGRSQMLKGVIQDSTFTQSDWHSTTHFCRSHKAISLYKAAFLQYILPFTTFIAIPDRDTRMEYRASVKDFRQYAIEHDRGRRIKLCLPLVYWSVIEPDGTKSAQLRLFNIEMS